MFDCVKKRSKRIEEPTSSIPDIMQEAHEEAEKYGDQFGSYRFIAFCDLGINSKEHRFWVHDKKHNIVYPKKTSHGSGKKGDRNYEMHNGHCYEISNTPGSHLSCVGMFRCAETYIGRNGYSMRLDGLSATNSNARSRAVVVHDHPASGRPVGQIEPRSWACFMFSEEDNIWVIDRLKNGSPLWVIHR